MTKLIQGHHVNGAKFHFTRYSLPKTWIHQSGKSSYHLTSMPSCNQGSQKGGKVCSSQMGVLILRTKHIFPRDTPFLALLPQMHPWVLALSIFPWRNPTHLSVLQVHGTGGLCWEEGSPKARGSSLHPPASTPTALAGSLMQPSDWWPLAIELFEVWGCVYFISSTKLEVHKGQALWLKFLL